MNVFEKFMGPGMAAPETPAIRRLRWTVIVLSALLCLGVVLIDVISASLGPVVTGAMFVALLGLTIGFGGVYFILKSRRDDEWLDERCRASGDE